MEASGKVSPVPYKYDPVKGNGRCYICQRDFNSEKQLRDHIASNKHGKLQAEWERTVDNDRGAGEKSVLCDVSVSAVQQREDLGLPQPISDRCKLQLIF